MIGCCRQAHRYFNGTNGAPRSSVKLPHPALAPHLRPASDCSMRYSTSCIHAVIGSTLPVVVWGLVGCCRQAHRYFHGTNGAPRSSVKLPHPALAPHLRPASDCSMRYSTSCIHAVVGSTLHLFPIHRSLALRACAKALVTPLVLRGTLTDGLLHGGVKGCRGK